MHPKNKFTFSEQDTKLSAAGINPVSNIPKRDAAHPPTEDDLINRMKICVGDIKKAYREAFSKFPFFLSEELQQKVKEKARMELYNSFVATYTKIVAACSRERYVSPRLQQKLATIRQESKQDKENQGGNNMSQDPVPGQKFSQTV